jgi:CRISPR-associated protein Csb1
LLVALALLKISRFLRHGLRLRTACDLEVVGELVTRRPQGFVVPGEEELLQECANLIAACRHLFAEPPITTIEWRSTRKRARSKAPGDQEDEA